MWLCLGFLSCFLVSFPPIVKKSLFSFLAAPCEYHSDCMLPEICCDGLLFNYCCFPGAGTMKRLPVPNKTFPEVPVLVPQFLF